MPRSSTLHCIARGVQRDYVPQYFIETSGILFGLCIRTRVDVHPLLTIAAWTLPDLRHVVVFPNRVLQDQLHHRGQFLPSSFYDSVNKRLYLFTDNPSFLLCVQVKTCESTNVLHLEVLLSFVLPAVFLNVVTSRHHLYFFTDTTLTSINLRTRRRKTLLSDTVILNVRVTSGVLFVTRRQPSKRVLVLRVNKEGFDPILPHEMHSMAIPWTTTLPGEVSKPYYLWSKPSSLEVHVCRLACLKDDILMYGVCSMGICRTWSWSKHFLDLAPDTSAISLAMQQPLWEPHLFNVVLRYSGLF